MVLCKMKLKYKPYLKFYELFWNKMTSRVHRALKILAFNANGIGRQRHELSKQLQDLIIDVALFSETHERFFITNYHVYRMDRYPGSKGGIAIAVSKGIPMIM
jgi:hypothetical protein